MEDIYKTQKSLSDMTDKRVFFEQEYNKLTILTKEQKRMIE
jgi:regulatory protein YycI of two-component signal transduction system YycFG